MSAPAALLQAKLDIAYAGLVFIIAPILVRRHVRWCSGANGADGDLCVMLTLPPRLTLLGDRCVRLGELLPHPADAEQGIRK